MRRVGAAFALTMAALAGFAAFTTPPSTDGYRASAVSGHARGTVVTVAIRIPSGSSSDPAGRSGAAGLLAQVLRDETRRALGPDVAKVSAAVDRSATTFTVIVLPEAWPHAREMLDSVIFEAPLDDSLVARDKRAQLSRLSFESGSPGAEFQAEAALLLAGDDSAWARPVHGTARSLAEVDTGVLQRYRAAHYRREQAVRAVVGPRAVVSPPSPTTPTAADSAAAPVPDTVTASSPDSAGRAAPPPATDTAPVPPAPSVAPASPPRDTTPRLAWTTGRRVAETRDVTSTWIRVAYPVSSATPRIAAEMLADLVETDLSPTPPDPDRYSVDVELRDAPGGSVLVVDAIVFPEAADRWEAKITEAVQALAAKPMAPDFFAWRRRRFRTERLLQEAAPEAEAGRMAADLLRHGRVRDLGEEIWALDAEALRRAAFGLGEPRVLRFGPDLAAR